MPVYCTRYKPANSGLFVANSAELINLYMSTIGFIAFGVLNVIALNETKKPGHPSNVSMRKIARITGASRTTISRAIDVLLQAGLIKSAGKEGGWVINQFDIDSVASLHPTFKDCWKCGSPGGDGILVLHYFDGDDQNRVQDNVCMLCPTCKARHEKGSEVVRKVETNWSVNSAGVQKASEKVVSEKCQGGIGEVPQVASEVGQGGIGAMPLYKNRRSLSEKEGMKEAETPTNPGSQRPDYCPEESRFSDGPIELPSFITSPDQVIEFKIYKAVEACKSLLETQVLMAGKLGNPILKRSFFLKLKYPATYFPNWAPLQHRQLFARTILLQATNVMCQVQRDYSSPVVIIPTSAKEVEVLGDVLSAFLGKQTWAPTFRDYLTWVGENKSNWSINLLGFYVGDWSKALSA